MTLANRYDKVMKHIEVTPEMHDRILSKINRLDSGKAQGKAAFLQRYGKAIPIAACAAVLVLGALVFGKVIHFTPEPVQQAIPHIVSCASLSELSKAVGFTVGEVSKVPFDVKEVRYTAFGKDLAEVEYVGGDHSLVFRMSSAGGDISGDYTEYGSVKDCETGGGRVTIKGDGGRYYLAVWESGGFTYSISIESGIDEAKMLEIVESVK